MDSPYHSIVKMGPSYEPTSYSCSQHTTVTNLSRENSLMSKSNKTDQIISSVQISGKQQERRKTFFAEALKKCTQKVLIFKTDVTPSSPLPMAIEGIAKVRKKNSSGSIKSGNTISNSSLKEIDEEEFTSSELAQMMHEINNEIKHLSSS